MGLIRTIIKRAYSTNRMLRVTNSEQLNQAYGICKTHLNLKGKQLLLLQPSEQTNSDIEEIKMDPAELSFAIVEPPPNKAKSNDPQPCSAQDNVTSSCPDAKEERPEINERAQFNLDTGATNANEPLPSEFEYLLLQLKETVEDTYVNWKQEPRNRYPRTLVLATKTMLSNYAQYRDLLSFDIYDKLLSSSAHDSKRYEVGLFSVSDGNQRPLLTGVAIFADQTAETIADIFCCFFNIHQKGPLTILTSNRKQIIQAIETLSSQQTLNCSHVLTPESVIASVRNNIGSFTGDAPAFLTNLKQAISTRDETVFSSSIDSLLKVATNEKSVKEMILDYQKAFYRRTGNSFVGLERNLCLKLRNEIKAAFHNRTDIAQFLRGICALDLKLSREANQKYQYFDARLESQMKDHRLKELRESFEMLTVVRFAENYTRALSSWKVSEASSNESIVVSKLGKQADFRIKNWKCSCQEMEKTGVACPHLIAAAIKDTQKSYVDLIKPEWYRKSPSSGE